MTIEAFLNMSPEQLWDLSGQLANLGSPESVAAGGVGVPPAAALQPSTPQPAFPNITAEALFPLPAVAGGPPGAPGAPGTPPEEGTKPEDLALALGQLQTPDPRRVVNPPGGSTRLGSGPLGQNQLLQLIQGFNVPPGQIRPLGV